MNRCLLACGFTLIEMALALIILALALGGLMAPLGLQQEARARQQATQALSDVREALLGFAVSNGRLPCPAQATLATDHPLAGQEAVTGSGASLGCACTTVSSGIASQGTVACDTNVASNSVSGVLPWATLGLPQLDPWGKRYSYRVTTFYARGLPQSTFGCTPASDPSQAAFALCSSGAITVLTASGGASLGAGIPAIVISHGKTGGGGYTSQGNLVLPDGASSDEQENQNLDAIYVSNPNSDDLLQWVPPGLLINRMLAAGRLP